MKQIIAFLSLFAILCYGCGSDCETPLIKAAKVNDLETVRQLLANGANPEEECNGKKPSHYGNPQIQRWLIRADAIKKAGYKPTLEDFPYY
jgi:hypothetical protein